MREYSCPDCGDRWVEGRYRVRCRNCESLNLNQVVGGRLVKSDIVRILHGL